MLRGLGCSSGSGVRGHVDVTVALMVSALLAGWPSPVVAQAKVDPEAGTAHEEVKPGVAWSLLGTILSTP